MLKNIKKTYLSAIALTVALFNFNSAYAHEGKHETAKASIVVDSAWTRASHAGAKTAAGYVHLVNNGDKDEYLTAVKSPISSKIQLHKMTLVNNVMQCKLLQHPILIKAHSDFTLKPGAYHIMFMDVKKQLVKGQAFPAVFFFKHNAPVNVTFSVGGMDDVAAPGSTPAKPTAAPAKTVTKEKVS